MRPARRARAATGRAKLPDGISLDHLPEAIAGENIAIEYRFANGELEPLLALAADLVRLGGDIVVTRSNPDTVAAMKTITTIPIVMTNSADPVGLGSSPALGLG